MPPAPAATHVLASLVGSEYLDQSLPLAFGELVPCNDSVCVSEQPFTVAGEAQPWGYLAMAAPTSRTPSHPLEAFCVRLRVLRGMIGIGLLDRPGGSTFLDVVDDLTPGEIRDVTFLVRGIREVGPVVVRNTGDVPPAFEWVSADSYRLRDVSEIAAGSRFPEEMAPVPGWNRYFGAFAGTPAEHVRQFAFGLMREPQVMPWRRDLQVVITPGEENSRALFVSGAYEPASMIAFSGFVFPGAVVIDIGANIGMYTLIGSRGVGDAGHVYSFEPSSRERAVLHRNLSLNNCGNVTVMSAAVTDRSGTGTLRVASGQHRGLNTLAPSFAYSGVGLECAEAVSLVSLDELWRSQRLRQPDVVKIDVEGAELEVLRGAKALLQESEPVIIFEINDGALRSAGASRGAVQDVLTGLGYTLHRVDDNTAAVTPVATLSGVESENFIALPSDRGPAAARRLRRSTGID